ncbi:hypothetical protein F4811DRAFT_555198 [Daldinia bambusicola]|nr:hypothetical protein F4811DRAFT_555198 [Daldinia bambusicola]
MVAEYHHVVDEGKGEVADTTFIQQYLRRTMDRLFIAGYLFLHGTELHIARHYRRESMRTINESLDPVEVARAVWLEARMSAAEELAIRGLGQYAILWSMNMGFEGLPPRPGSESDPRRNGGTERLLNLRAVPIPDNEVVIDASHIKWPYYVVLDRKYQAGIEAIPGVPVIVPSLIKGTELKSLVDSAPPAQPSVPHRPQTGSVGAHSNPDYFARRGGQTVHRVEAILSHRPLTEARRAVKWYKVRWAEDFEDKETWVHDNDVSTVLIHAYWQKLEADIPPQ